MAIRSNPHPITGVQIIIARKEGDEVTLKSLDIPIRDEKKLDMVLEADEMGVSFHLDVPNESQYTVSYIIRDQEKMEDPTTPLLPYVDGIYSETQVAGIKAELEFKHQQEIDRLERKLKRRDKALRALRREKAERKRLKI